jgi:hypothetical protein
MPTTTPTTPTMTKELVIVSGDIRGEVEVCQTDTLHDVRALILEEFDDDMLPFEDFCFHVNDIRISEKQEGKKQAWTLSTISLHSKPKQGTKRKLKAFCSCQQNTGKRGRSENEIPNETPAPTLSLACSESPPVSFFKCFRFRQNNSI